MTRTDKQPQEQQPKPAQEHLAKQGGSGNGSSIDNNNTQEQTMTNTAEIQMIPLSQLFRSAFNVRKSGSGDVADLAASIKANDVIQNLVVIPEKKGKREGFGVVAGGRRLEALAQLLKAGEVDGEKLIPCRVVEKAEAVELSTTENVLREAMHPADEFEAFAAMVAKGKTVEEVAGRFGTSVRRVQQRMKLAKLSPKIIGAYRAGKITLDIAEAFTLTDDHKAQESILKGMRHLSPYYIKQALAGEAVRESDARVVFVGEDAYVAAGGTLRADMFSSERYYESVEILDALVSAKLEAKAEKLRKSFAWVEVEPRADWRTRDGFAEVPMIDGEVSAEVAAQLAEQREEVARLEKALDDDEDGEQVYDDYRAAADRLRELEGSVKVPHPDAAALTGAVVMLKDSGKLEILKGVLRKADRAKLTRKDTSGNAEAGEEGEAGEADPNAVRIDLTAFATGVAQVETAKNVPVALRLLAFQLARSSLRYGYENVVDIRATGCGGLTRNSETLTASPLMAELDAVDEQWSAELPDDPDALLAWCLAADDAKVNSLLAYITARSINGVQQFAGTARSVSPILAALNVDMRQHWKAPANYFARIKKADTLRILAEHGHAGPELAKMKRGALAAHASELLQGTGWLPPSIR